MRSRISVLHTRDSRHSCTGGCDSCHRHRRSGFGLAAAASAASGASSCWTVSRWRVVGSLSPPTSRPGPALYSTGWLLLFCRALASVLKGPSRAFSGLGQGDGCADSVAFAFLALGPYPDLVGGARFQFVARVRFRTRRRGSIPSRWRCCHREAHRCDAIQRRRPLKSPCGGLSR